MVDPDITGVGKHECVAAPYVSRVEVGNGDVLDNYVFDTRESQALSYIDGSVSKPRQH